MGRERFSSRLGFILISAGCAIGLGNVWRFPYIVGQYGGAAFVLIYAAFLVLLGLPIIVMEARRVRRFHLMCWSQRVLSGILKNGSRWRATMS